jgi:hypothetical protein
METGGLNGIVEMLISMPFLHYLWVFRRREYK